jgi:hypothetical protein
MGFLAVVLRFGYCPHMSFEAKSETRARIEITPPRRVKAGALAAICAYGFLVCAPVIVSVPVISVMNFGVLTFLIPLAAVAAATFFLPIGFGNPYVTSLVRSLTPAAGKDRDGFVVQLALSPRLSSGIRALIEDADDFGCLSFTSSELVFRGDSINLSIPFNQIGQVERRSIGWRGLFLGQNRIVIAVSGLPEVDSIEFAERSSWVLPASRAVTGRMFDRLSRLSAKPAQ